jgi:putative FmdB family regulatory protein
VPTYEYACLDCGNHVEVYQRFSDEPLSVCGVCGGALRKVFHPAGILFKGSGFYATDSRSSKVGSKSGGDGSASRSEKEKTGTTRPADSGGSESAAQSESQSSGKKEKSA